MKAKLKGEICSLAFKAAELDKVLSGYQPRQTFRSDP